MKISWLGHSAFKLEESTGTTVVTDPYDSDVVGYDMPKIKADIVTISHNHNDHNCVENIIGRPNVLNTCGSFEVGGIHIKSIQSFHGSGRGENLIFKFRLDGVDVLHLGDIGEECNSDLSENIGAVNILLIPVGGNFTIDAEQAKEYVDFLMPDIVIPMHYKTRDCEIDLDKVDQFTKLFDDNDVVYVSDELEFDRGNFEGENTKVIVFEK